MTDHFYTIKEVITKYVDGCADKITTPVFILIGKAILAGIFVGLGGSASSAAAHTIENASLARLITACVFSVGLMMIVMLGTELFTGNCLMAMGTAAGRHKYLELLKVLLAVYVGNFIGTTLLALAVYASGQLHFSDNLLGAYAIKIALTKVNFSFGNAIVSGILCNILVCTAVLMTLCSKDVCGKLFSSFFVIMLFSVSGFEHCVANMYFISAGLIAKQNPLYVQQAIAKYGYNAEQLASLNIPSFLLSNLLPVTIGNMIGGVFIGLSLYYLLNTQKHQTNNIIFVFLFSFFSACEYKLPLQMHTW